MPQFYVKRKKGGHVNTYISKRLNNVPLVTLSSCLPTSVFKGIKLEQQDTTVVHFSIFPK